MTKLKLFKQQNISFLQSPMFLASEFLNDNSHLFCDADSLWLTDLFRSWFKRVYALYFFDEFDESLVSKTVPHLIGFFNPPIFSV